MDCPKCEKKADLLFPKSYPKSHRYYCTPCKFRFIKEKEIKTNKTPQPRQSQIQEFD